MGSKVRASKCDNSLARYRCPPPWGTFCPCLVPADPLTISELCKVCKEESPELSKDAETPYFFFHLEIGHNYWS